MKKIIEQLKPYSTVAIIVFISLLVQAFSPTSIELFRYQSAEVASGEWWRIITANFSHSNWNHWALNMSGLLLIDYLFQPLVNQKLRASLLLFCIVFNTFCIHLWMSVDWYVGLSGALHGFLIGCALLSIGQAKWMNLIIVSVVFSKIFIEMNWEVNQLTESFIEANVFEEAHLFGAISGALFAMAIYLFNFLQNKKRA